MCVSEGYCDTKKVLQGSNCNIYGDNDNPLNISPRDRVKLFLWPVYCGRFQEKKLFCVPDLSVVLVPLSNLSLVYQELSVMQTDRFVAVLRATPQKQQS